MTQNLDRCRSETWPPRFTSNSRQPLTLAVLSHSLPFASWPSGALRGPPGGPIGFQGCTHQGTDVGFGGVAEIFCSIPALTPTWPISTVHTAKTQSVREPQRNRFVLRPIAYYRHYGAAAWINPVVLSAITISWNKIVIPVRSCPHHGHPDERPFPRFTNDFGLLRMRCCTKRAQATQDHGRSQSYDHYPHALAPCHTQPRPNSDISRRSTSSRC